MEPDYPTSRDELYQRLKDDDIFTRRYFYPLISEFPMYRDIPSATQENLTVASKISEQILCLPIYPSIDVESLCEILSVVNK